MNGVEAVKPLVMRLIHLSYKILLSSQTIRGRSLTDEPSFSIPKLPQPRYRTQNSPRCGTVNILGIPRLSNEARCPPIGVRCMGDITDEEVSKESRRESGQKVAFGFGWEREPWDQSSKVSRTMRPSCLCYTLYSRPRNASRPWRF